MGFMQRLLYKFQSFMMGRYGVDQLGVALLLLGLVLSGVLSIVLGLPWSYLAYIPYGYELYRMFSRKIESRRRENQAFLKVWLPIASWCKVRRAAFRDRKQYKYFRCPSCGLNLRAPRGKGKIRITCQRCHKDFIRKT